MAKEWNQVRNYPLNPSNFSSASHAKVWWQCPKFPNHEYEAVIKDRTGNKKTGCPMCGGKKISPERSLAILSPEIAEEWHPTKNGSLTPKDVFNRSKKIVWWQCPTKSPEHDYQTRISVRTEKHKHGCPFCAGVRKIGQ